MVSSLTETGQAIPTVCDELWLLARRVKPIWLSSPTSTSASSDPSPAALQLADGVSEPAPRDPTMEDRSCRCCLSPSTTCILIVSAIESSSYLRRCESSYSPDLKTPGLCPVCGERFERQLTVKRPRGWSRTYFWSDAARLFCYDVI